MLCRMMLCKIVCRFSFPAFHAMRKFLKGFWSQIQKYFIFVARYCCFLVVSLVIPEAVALSVHTFVMGCGWSISSNLFHMTTPYFALRYIDMSSASAANDITLRIIVDTTCNSPLLIIGWPRFCLFVQKKFPPSQLHAFGSNMYKASLWIARIV